MWACKGHGKAQLNAFFDLLTDEQRGAIEVVTADGATWIADVVEARCPNAERVMDPFHVVSWATSALDELRKQAWRDARKDKTPEGKAAAKDVKGSGPGVSVEVDGTMLHESFSGNATRGAFAMPRRARRTYRDLHVRGVSGQLACVVCGANDRGDAFCEVVGRAHGTSGAILAALSGRVGPGTALATDDLPAYGGVAASLGAEHEVRPARGPARLGMVNALHKRLADFLCSFNGVATRRLQRYLGWFCWSEQFRRGDADRRELACREARSGTYSTSVRDIFAEPRLFMGYWEDRSVSMAV